jgi:hypothetical protein
MLEKNARYSVSTHSPTLSPNDDMARTYGNSVKY